MARPMNKSDAAGKTDSAPKEVKPGKPAKPASEQINYTVVYMGPNHPAGFLSKGQVFKAPLAGPVAEVLNSAPEIMEPLFVPLPRLMKAKQDQADPASDLSRAYAKAAEHLVGGK